MNRFFRTVLSIFIVGLLFTQPVQAQASERINLFASEITIHEDTSIGVREVIQYVTSESKHGIYRYIPIRYSRGGLNYSARVRDISVTDRKGDPIPFQRSVQQGNVSLKIGDPDKTFTGQQIYFIDYTVENAVQLVEDPTTGEEVPELYWDITGEGWQIHIDRTEVVLLSPYADVLSATCYSGAYGQDDGLCEGMKIAPGRAEFEYEQPVTYGDNVTVAVAIDPEGGLVFPTQLEVWMKGVRDNLPLLLVLLPAVIMGGWWWLRGRDSAFLSWNVFNQDESRPTRLRSVWKRRPIPLVYEPIADLTPGEAGAILDERVDNQDVIAEIIDLARQKYLKIESEEKKKLLVLKETEYTFTKLKEAEDPNADGRSLPEHQQYLLKQIFKKGDTVKLSELKGEFYTAMTKTKKLIFESLMEKGLFTANPQNTQALAIVVCVFLLFGAGFVMVLLLQQAVWWSVPLFIVSSGVALLAAFHMPAKTATGTNYSLQAQGLRRSINYGAWRERIKEKRLFIEEVLPFAVALGVVDKLASDMEELNIKPPEYLSQGMARGMSTHSFVNSFTSDATSNLTYNPNSSSWSSGGSSGGGFSGGGGGGGGGGSW